MPCLLAGPTPKPPQVMSLPSDQFVLKCCPSQHSESNNHPHYNFQLSIATRHDITTAYQCHHSYQSRNHRLSVQSEHKHPSPPGSSEQRSPLTSKHSKRPDSHSPVFRSTSNTPNLDVFYNHLAPSLPIS